MFWWEIVDKQFLAHASLWQDCQAAKQWELIVLYWMWQLMRDSFLQWVMISVRVWGRGSSHPCRASESKTTWHRRTAEKQHKDVTFKTLWVNDGPGGVAVWNPEMIMIMLLAILCLAENGPCSQQCTTVAGQAHCSCFPGFSLMTDGHMCEGKGCRSFLSWYHWQ